MHERGDADLCGPPPPARLPGAARRLFSDADRDKTMLDVIESETYGNGITKIVADVKR
jgi:hypothetical protein